mgnify:CR=1 FL=1
MQKRATHSNTRNQTRATTPPLPLPPQETDSAKRLKELIENEKKGAGRPTKETQEELQESEAVFGGF